MIILYITCLISCEKNPCQLSEALLLVEIIANPQLPIPAIHRITQVIYDAVN